MIMAGGDYGRQWLCVRRWGFHFPMCVSPDGQSDVVGLVGRLKREGPRVAVRSGRAWLLVRNRARTKTCAGMAAASGRCCPGIATAVYERRHGANRLPTRCHADGIAAQNSLFHQNKSRLSKAEYIPATSDVVSGLAGTALGKAHKAGSERGTVLL
jgi:hypothetical protein